jgi:hypothetical protein
MFGAVLRAAPQALFMALLAAVAARVTDPLFDFMASGPAQSDDLLLGSLQAATDNILLVGVLALILTLLARAVIEARIGGGGI